MMCVYQEWKKNTDSIYSGGISEHEGTSQLIRLLYLYGIKKRSNHELRCISYFVYDKRIYSDQKKEKPLDLGLVYRKPDRTLTQDIFIINPNNPEIECFYLELEMVNKYPAMKGVHKSNLPWHN